MFRTLLLAILSLFIALNSQAAEKPNQPANFTMHADGVGEIKAGDTVKARRDAVEMLLKNALRNRLSGILSPTLLNDYNGCIDDNVVERVNNFVKNYSVEEELAEGTSYRVKARVDFDQERLMTELRTHGLLPLEGNRPRLLLFVQQTTPVAGKSTNKKNPPVVPVSAPWGWWLDVQPAPAVYVQDLMATRLIGISVNVQAWRKVLQEGPTLVAANNGEGFAPIYGRIKSSPAIVVDDYLKLAQLTQANYVVFGTTDTDFMRADLQVVRAEDHKFVGRINITHNELQQGGLQDLPSGSAGGYRRMEVLNYRLAGLVLQDWLERWQIEHRVFMRVRPVKDLKTFNELLKAFADNTIVTSVREESFQHQTVTLRLGTSKAADEIAKSVQQLDLFKGRSRITIKDDKNIEVEWQ